VTQHLLYDSAQRAIDFASSMIDDGLWAAGRSKASAARLARAQSIVATGLSLYGERWVRERAGKPNDALDALMSDLALEISKLANAAIADRSMRLAHFDPWVLTHVRENDADERAELQPAA